MAAQSRRGCLEALYEVSGPQHEVYRIELLRGLRVARLGLTPMKSVKWGGLIILVGLHCFVFGLES